MIKKTKINRNIILIDIKDGHDKTRQVAQTDKKLENPFIQNSEKEPEQEYGQSELDIIFESDSEDFLKNDILRTVCAIVCGTDYAAHFQIFVNINGYNTRTMVDSDATGNFILIRIIIKK